jgi:hypothetical protein
LSGNSLLFARAMGGGASGGSSSSSGGSTNSCQAPNNATIGPADPKSVPNVPPDPAFCGSYRDGTGMGDALNFLCMHLYPWNPNSPSSNCVRGKLLQQYPGNPGSFQFWWYLGPDHVYDISTCAVGR